MEIFGQTDRLILRRMNLDDFGEVATIMRGEQVQEIWENYFSDEDVKNWIQRNLDKYKDDNSGYFLGISKESNQIVGQFALMKDVIDSKSYYEVGYILKKEFTNKGFAVEGAKFMADYAFSKLGQKEVIFEIRPCNRRSIKVAKTIGAIKTGNFIKNVQGKNMEHLIFTLIK